MDVRDIRSGDVLLFSAHKSNWVTRVIAKLTNAPVSHAAMCYQIPTKLVEEIAPKVSVSEATLRFVDHTVHVLRLNQPAVDMRRLDNISKSYLNKLPPYTEANLFFIAQLLIYKKFTPSSLVQDIAIKIFKKLTAMMIYQLKEKLYPLKLPMSSAQFVYECYQEAGKNYHLHFRETMAFSHSKRSNILQHAFVHSAEIELLHSQQGHLDDETLAMQLYRALSDEELNTGGTVSKELLDSVHEFAKAIHGLAKHSSYELAEARQGIAILEAQSSSFITPGDLLQHCSNLQPIGAINLK